MKLIIGLGNPGAEYANTRHNVGYMVVDQLKVQSAKFKDMTFAKTNVFMNESGQAVKRIMPNAKCQMPNLYIVHDDLDIPLGQFKIQFGKGPKDHKGIQSIEEALKTDQFWRVRVGVDNRDPKSRIPGEEYVLQEFNSQEQEVLTGVISKVTQELAKLP
ncbi:aminoacyl-tRNA hydrolase [Candidatus Microgenomates bacterium]|nr:aminoacyl-tRNA hydrolase [Candidatus Microgenomates bacterium]